MCYKHMLHHPHSMWFLVSRTLVYRNTKNSAALNRLKPIIRFFIKCMKKSYKPKDLHQPAFPLIHGGPQSILFLYYFRPAVTDCVYKLSYFYFLSKNNRFTLSENRIPILCASFRSRALSREKSMVSLHVTLMEDARAASPPSPTFESFSIRGTP